MFACLLSQLTLTSLIAYQAIVDVREGVHQGWITPDLHEVPMEAPPSNGGSTALHAQAVEALRFLHSAEAEVLCDVINVLAGRAVMSAVKLRALAALPRRQTSNELFYELRVEA